LDKRKCFTVFIVWFFSVNDGDMLLFSFYKMGKYAYSFGRREKWLEGVPDQFFFKTQKAISIPIRKKIEKLLFSFSLSKSKKRCQSP
jgi:hypothetical protein